MTSSQSGVSPLRQRMIDDMRVRQLSPKTQANYLRIVREFTRYLGRSPDTATVEDLRSYQLHLVNHGTSSSSAPHRFVHHQSRSAQHERYRSVLTTPNVGFAATRPTSERMRLSLRKTSRTCTSRSRWHDCAAPSLRQCSSRLPIDRNPSNIAPHPGQTIAIVLEIGPLRGFLPRGLFGACPQASLHTHRHVNEGRHRATLNVCGSSAFNQGARCSR